MRTIIAGSRGFTDINEMADLMNDVDWQISLVISGGARGADSLGERWARNNHIPYKVMPADWDKYGRSAGYRRNVDMANNADALVLFWDGSSRGSKHMLDIARDKGLLIKVFLI